MVVLFGPTAVGKTQVIETLFPTGFEIVSADSLEVYRGVDIGSAKPDLAVRGRIPHHLIDILDPSEQFTCGDFVRLSEALIRQITGRGRIPLVSGGTAYYLRNLVFGLPRSPGADRRVREELQTELQERGLESLREELRKADPESAAAIGARDAYRITRALEILRTAGVRRSDIEVPATPRADLRMLLIGLSRPREELRRRIDLRVDRMFAAGLVAEVKGLLRRGFGSADPGMRGIGYREFFDMPPGCRSLGDVREAVKLHSRRYAKRQMTFFRGLPGVHWLDPDQPLALTCLLRRFLGADAELDHAHEVLHNAASPPGLERDDP